MADADEEAARAAAIEQCECGALVPAPVHNSVRILRRSSRSTCGVCGLTGKIKKLIKNLDAARG
ncbi:MAG: hypothetical protein ACPIOQ_77520 [Promethearchaeia archaeon]